MIVRLTICNRWISVRKLKSWVQVVSRQKLNWNRENIVLYSINLDVFSIANEFLMTNNLDSGCIDEAVG